MVETVGVVERLWRLWSAGNMVVPAGGILKGNKDTSPVLAINASTVELRMPVEMQTGDLDYRYFQGSGTMEMWAPDYQAPVSLSR